MKLTKKYADGSQIQVGDQVLVQVNHPRTYSEIKDSHLYIVDKLIPCRYLCSTCNARVMLRDTATNEIVVDKMCLNSFGYQPGYCMVWDGVTDIVKVNRKPKRINLRFVGFKKQ